MKREINERAILSPMAAVLPLFGSLLATGLMLFPKTCAEQISFKTIVHLITTCAFTYKMRTDLWDLRQYSERPSDWNVDKRQC